MTNRRVLWLVPVLALMVLGASCGKKAAENAVEKTVENATNGQADVDLGTNTVSINVNGTSVKTGTALALPTNFPTDVYVIDGTIKSSLATPGVGYTVALETTKSVAQAKALYDQKLPTDGWTITTSAVINEHSSAVMATKSGRSVQITIGDADGPNVVAITVLDKTTTTNISASTPSSD